MWDVLPIFTQETIYHVHTEMREFVQGLNCGTAELQDKDCSECGIRTAELNKVTAYSLCESGNMKVIEYSVCRSGTSSHKLFCVWNISGSSCNGSNDTRAQGPQAPGSKPSWRCCYLLFHLGGKSTSAFHLCPDFQRYEVPLPHFCSVMTAKYLKFRVPYFRSARTSKDLVHLPHLFCQDFQIWASPLPHFFSAGTSKDVKFRCRTSVLP